MGRIYVVLMKKYLQKARKDNDREGDIPDNGGVIRKLLERTINITEYRNAEDHVNPAKDRTFGSITHHLGPFH